jgi:hypothetical protein
MEKLRGPGYFIVIHKWGIKDLQIIRKSKCMSKSSETPILINRSQGKTRQHWRAFLVGPAARERDVIRQFM